MRYDVIVVGMGIHGLMATYQLARRGLRVLGVDRDMVPHRRGSSHGQTRVHRRAYFEAPFYVPLLKRADELWEQLSNEIGAARLGITQLHPDSPLSFPSFLNRTGVLVIGRDDGRLASGALASAREHRIHVKVMDAAEAMQLWPGLSIPADHVAILEPLGGVLQVESVLQQLWEESLELGALCIGHCSLLGWQPDSDGVKVRLEGFEESFEAERLILSCGAWLGDAARLNLPLDIERQYQVLFSTRDGSAYRAGDFPAIAVDRGHDPMLYGIPDFGNGIKLAFHHGGRSGDPQSFEDPAGVEIARLHQAASQWLTGIGSEVMNS